MEAFTTSPMLMIPRSWPFSTTGKWRTRAWVISAITARTVSSGVQVVGERDITADAGCSRAPAPWRASAVTMSRSVMRPSS